ncbi:hypothetical protein, partial [Mammaliicoccus sciuri]
GIANVRYVDRDTGKDILPVKEHEGDIKGTVKLDNKKSELYNQGYDFVSVDASDKNNFNQQTDTVTYTTNGQNVVYYFVKANGQLISKYI